MVNVFQNLISNSLKFRDNDRPARIAIEGKCEDRHWLISVRDNGIGFEPQYSEKVFKIFQRLHGRGEYDGTGVGLAVCRKIIERHDGRIWVDPVLGQGITVNFTLPCQA